MGAVAQLRRTASVRACSQVRALQIGSDALLPVARATPELLIDIIGQMGDRLRKFNGAIGLYTHALGAIEQHDFDPALLDDTIERVNITLPRRVLRRLDALAKAAGESRSGFIAHLTLEA